MKKLLTALMIMILPMAAHAGINGLNDPQLEVTPPTTPAILEGLIGCQNYSLIIDDAAGVEWIVQGCSGSSYTLEQFWPPDASTFTNLSAIHTSNITNDSGYVTSSYVASLLSGYLTTTTAASTYFAKPTGTSSQYLDGTGSPQTFPSSTPTITHPSRSLTTCFQPSAGSATSFVYSVNMNATLISLGGGTAKVTQYNDSGCSMGALVIADGAVSSVALGGNSSIPLVGDTPAGKYLEITGTASGGATAVIDTVTTERQ